MPEPTPKIFISYAWKNQPTAKRLQSDLKRDGVEVFVDYEKITGGDSLPERISAALDWCNTLVLLWSADSAESYYVKQEWTSAFHLQKKIIACVLDGKKLPALLSGNLYLNFSPYETGYGQLCRSLGVTPKPRAEKTAPPEVTTSKLPPQHAEMPVPQSPDEKRESPPPKRKSFAETFRRKTKPSDPTPVLKPPADQAILIPTEEFSVESPAPVWWRRRLAMNIVLLIIIAIVVAIVVYIAFQSKWLESDGNKLTPQKPVTMDSTKADSTKLPAQKPKAQKLQAAAETRAPTKKGGERASEPRYSFRKDGKELSVDEMKQMLVERRFFDSYWHKDGKGIKHQYKDTTRFGKKLVIDYATDLVWQQFGSEEEMTYEEANAYVAQLCRENYGGYSNWRLPTLEEAMSLMEPNEPDGDLYIDLLFDRKQRWIWTADQHSAGVAWVAYFDLGHCGHTHVTNYNFVRVVR